MYDDKSSCNFVKDVFAYTETLLRLLLRLGCRLLSFIDKPDSEESAVPEGGDRGDRPKYYSTLSVVIVYFKSI